MKRKYLKMSLKMESNTSVYIFATKPIWCHVTDYQTWCHSCKLADCVSRELPAQPKTHTDMWWQVKRQLIDLFVKVFVGVRNIPVAIFSNAGDCLGCLQAILTILNPNPLLHIHTVTERQIDPIAIPSFPHWVCCQWPALYKWLKRLMQKGDACLKWDLSVGLDTLLPSVMKEIICAILNNRFCFVCFELILIFFSTHFVYQDKLFCVIFFYFFWFVLFSWAYVKTVENNTGCGCVLKQFSSRELKFTVVQCVRSTGWLCFTSPIRDRGARNHGVITGGIEANCSVTCLSQSQSQSLSVSVPLTAATGDRGS